MQRGDGDEDRRVADGRRRHATDRALDLTVVVHVGVIERELPTAAHGAAGIRLALEEHVDEASREVGVVGAVREVETGTAKRLPYWWE